MSMKIWTIGHSTHSIAEFLSILRDHDIQSVADIRRFPGSKRLPHFNKESLRNSLEAAGIEYHHFEGLGGRRNPVPGSRNSGWKVLAFRGYADYMETQAFVNGLDELVVLAGAMPTAIMCAEAVPWRCHRQLVADALVARGVEVRHITSISSAPLHTLTDFAQVEQGRVAYRRLI